LKFRIPATSANIGSGFDALGIALSMYNEVEIDESDSLQITSLDGVEVPEGEDNLIVVSARRLYEECGRQQPKGFRIAQSNVIPMTRGLGSSSACVAAGLLGANYLLGKPLTREELVNIACQIEGHPDNTTPALLGGLTSAAVENGRVYAVTLHVADKFRFAAFIPDFELKTSVARGILPGTVSREDAVYNLSRSALMAGSLATGNVDNLRVAVQDRLHQPYRMALIPGAEEIFRLSYEFGSYATYISGAGPTVMSIISRRHEEEFETEITRELEKRGLGNWRMVILDVDSGGARRIRPQ
jgi:homoserine kinase